MVTQKNAILIALLMLLAVVLAVVILRPRIHERPFREAKTLMRLTRAATALRAYQEIYGKLPQGDTPTIISTLAGENPRGIVFLEVNSDEMSNSGEWVDQWGMPIRLIRESSTNIAFRSYGPNRRDDGGSNDDLSVPATWQNEEKR
jgi:hypothetical protein